MADGPIVKPNKVITAGWLAAITPGPEVVKMMQLNPALPYAATPATPAALQLNVGGPDAIVTKNNGG